MSKQKTVIKKRKSNPTIFPFGFGIAKIEEHFIVIDFFDDSGEKDEYIVVGSVAMPKDKALDLANTILNALGQEGR